MFGSEERTLQRYLVIVNHEMLLRLHASMNHKMIQLCWGPETGRQQNASNCWGVKTPPQQNDTRGKWYTFIDEVSFYELVFSSKLEAAKRFRDWVFTTVLPSICKYAQYKLFDNPWNKMIMIGNETDRHYTRLS